MKKLIILLIILISFWAIYIPANNIAPWANNVASRENFRSPQTYCPECSYKTKFDCSLCENCGYCYHGDGQGECVSGDQHGPYFNQDCLNWVYEDIEDNSEHPYYHPISYFEYSDPQYRHYYGKGAGRRISHHNNW